jgi:hypothetical protein
MNKKDNKNIGVKPMLLACGMSIVYKYVRLE